MQQTLSDKYTVAGFGYTEHGSDSDVLLKILVPKVSRETCQSFHRSLILSDGHSCYGGEGIIDSCKGLINCVRLHSRQEMEREIKLQWKFLLIFFFCRRFWLTIDELCQCQRSFEGSPNGYSRFGSFRVRSWCEKFSRNLHRCSISFKMDIQQYRRVIVARRGKKTVTNTRKCN